MIRMFSYLKKYRLLILVPFIFMITSMILDMFNPVLSQMIIDRVIVNKETELMLKLVIGLAAISLSRAVFGYIREFMFDYIGVKVQQDIRRELFEHIQSLNFSYFDSMNTGELMSRIGQDVDNIWSAMGFGIGLLIDNALYFVTAAGILIYINWKLALFTLVTMPIIAYLAFKLEKEIGKAFDKISDQAATLNTAAQENIAGVRLVKAFAREKYEIMKFLEMNKKNYDLNMEKTKIWGRYFPLIELLGNISVVVVVVAGGVLVINENLTIGTLFAYTQYIWMLIWPMRMIGWLTNVISESKTSAKKIFKILDTEPIIKDPDNPEELNADGHIVLRNVSFKYNENYVLKNININAKPGSTVAIMGETGSGKTTLINLLARFYDTTEGDILLDGHNIKDLRIADLRKNISYVFQDNFLFSDTIKENIKNGNENADDYLITKALSDGCAQEFVEKLNDGYNTLIGERGIGLSGGQKQRLTISRALIKNAKILILDDATSALDMETEYQLLKNIKEFEGTVTTFIIAHRISAVKNADEIIYLKNGEITERGTHESLMNKKGDYYNICMQQFKDFEDIKNGVI
ncbi:MAG: ABC transporter ATP-binding protein [Thermotogae bacterium]|nr:ABC transporter ATP-binding protein [Thermotogota bacterium]